MYICTFMYIEQNKTYTTGVEFCVCICCCWCRFHMYCRQAPNSYVA